LLLSKKLNKESSQLLGDRSEEVITNGGDDISQEQSADSEKLVSDQIMSTLEQITKIEASLQQDISGEDSSSKERRTSEKGSPSKGHERRHSHMEQRKMDTTIMSDIEYLNILPDLDN
jgi:hypothetical protein